MSGEPNHSKAVRSDYAESPPSSLLARRLALIAQWCARHAIIVVIIAVIAVGVSIMALHQMSVEGSLQAMLGDRTPAAAALGRIVSQYRAIDELLIVATLPDDESSSRENQRRLIDLAERLEAAIAASPTLAPPNGMCRHIRYRPDPALQQFIRTVMLPAGALYLDDDGFSGLLSRLTLPEMHMQMARNEAMLAAPGPAASAMSKSILHDPLRLYELVDERSQLSSLGFGRQPTTDGQSPRDGEFSDDGRSLLILVGGSRSASDLEFAQRFTDEITVLVTAVSQNSAMTQSPVPVTMRVGGGYAIAAFNSRIIRKDAIWSTISSIVLVELFFIGYYRRAIAPVLIAVVAAMGIVLAFGVHTLHALSITPLTATAAAMLAGLGVDYGIHFLSHYQSHRKLGASSAEASGATINAIGPAMISACVTTLLGFSALWTARISMLRDFAVLGSLGLLGALVAVFTLMPALLSLMPVMPQTREPPSTRPVANVTRRHLIRPITRHSVLSLATLMVLGAAIVCLVFRGIPSMESTLNVMHPRPNPPLDATGFVQEQFSSMGGSVPIDVRGDNSRQLLINAHDVAGAIMKSQAALPDIAAVLGVCTLLPDPRVVAARKARLSQLDLSVVLSAFDQALQESIFDPNLRMFDEYRSFLRSLFTVANEPDISDLMKYPTLAEEVLPAAVVDDANRQTEPTSTLLLARLSASIYSREERDRIVSGLQRAVREIPDAVVTGNDAISYELEQTLSADLPRAAVISFGAVLIWLFITFRRVTDVAFAFIPIGCATVCLVACMAMFNIKLNPVNAVALPLLAGIAVDSGIFLVSAWRREDSEFEGVDTARATRAGIFAAATTTILGFGTLYWSRTPAVQSLGAIAAVGIFAGLVSSLFLLWPLLILMRSRKSP